MCLSVCTPLYLYSASHNCLDVVSKSQRQKPWFSLSCASLAKNRFANRLDHSNQLFGGSLYIQVVHGIYPPRVSLSNVLEVNHESPRGCLSLDRRDIVAHSLLIHFVLPAGNAASAGGKPPELLQRSAGLCLHNPPHQQVEILFPPPNS